MTNFFQKTLEAVLPKGKYELVHAPDGEVGFEMLRSEKPDLVILDLMMPKVDGGAFLKKSSRNRRPSKSTYLSFFKSFKRQKNK